MQCETWILFTLCRSVTSLVMDCPRLTQRSVVSSNGLTPDERIAPDELTDGARADGRPAASSSVYEHPGTTMPDGRQTHISFMEMLGDEEHHDGLLYEEHRDGFREKKKR